MLLRSLRAFHIPSRAPKDGSDIGGMGVSFLGDPGASAGP